jgi:predicted ATPase
VQQSAPFYCWAPVVSDLLGLPELIDADNRQEAFEKIVAHLGPESKWMQYLPLLNALIPDLRIEDTELIAESSGAERREMICSLVLFLLREAVATKPVLLILEDIQWMDMNSTLLALEALQNVKPISVVLTSRKMATPPSPAYVKLRAQCKELISLNLLPPSECVAIAANVLGVANLDDTVKHVLQSILNNIPGNPFFVQEFALGLLEAGEIIIEDGQCTISDTLGSNMHLLPTNVTAVISSRIDRLGTSAQMVLKVGMSRNRSPITAVPTEQPLISACFVVQLRSLERNSRCRS